MAQRFTPSVPAPLVSNFLYVHKGTPLGAWTAPPYTMQSAQSDTPFGLGLARVF